MAEIPEMAKFPEMVEMDENAGLGLSWSWSESGSWSVSVSDLFVFGQPRLNQV